MRCDALFDLTDRASCVLVQQFHQVPLSDNPVDPSRRSSNPAVLIFGQHRDCVFRWKARTSALRSIVVRPDPFDIVVALSKAKDLFTKSAFHGVRFGEPVTRSGWSKVCVSLSSFSLCFGLSLLVADVLSRVGCLSGR